MTGGRSGAWTVRFITCNSFEFYFPVSIGHFILNCVQMTRNAYFDKKKKKKLNSFTPSVFLMLMKLNSIWNECAILNSIPANAECEMRACILSKYVVGVGEKISFSIVCFPFFFFYFRIDRSISVQIIHARNDISAATMVTISHANVPMDEMVSIAVKSHEWWVWFNLWNKMHWQLKKEEKLDCDIL